MTGTLLGAYATTNNRSSTAKAYVSRWIYTPLAQEIAEDVFVGIKQVL